jgi:chromosomal replication initiation ATPase DnaA
MVARLTAPVGGEQLAEFRLELARLGLQKVVLAAAGAVGATPEEVRGPSKARHVLQARRACYEAVAAVYPAWSDARIGRLFGRDGNTVMRTRRRGT